MTDADVCTVSKTFVVCDDPHQLNSCLIYLALSTLECEHVELFNGNLDRIRMLSDAEVGGKDESWTIEDQLKGGIQKSFNE